MLFISPDKTNGDGMVNVFEAKRGIERSTDTAKETGWYGDTGISCH